MRRVKVKICGMKDPQNIEKIALFDPDFMGFIFYPRSPRFATPHSIKSVVQKLPSKIERTGVFVDSTDFEILQTCSNLEIQTVQLHGSEPPKFCETLRHHGLKIVKSFPIKELIDTALIKEYTGTIDYVLLDTASALHGGSGKAFDWSLLSQYELEIPLIVSGGIGPDNIGKLLQIIPNIPSFFAIDINSKVEISPGIKSEALVSKLFSELDT